MKEPTAPAPYEQPAEPGKPENLTDQQARFCREYVVDMNGFRAATRAGYSEASATVKASQNLAKPKIRSYIEDLQAVALEEMGVCRFRVLQEWSRIGYSDIRDVIDSDGNVTNPADWDDDAAAAIASFEVIKTPNGSTHKVRMWEKTRALEQLGKCLGLAKEDATTVAVQVVIGEADAAGF